MQTGSIKISELNPFTQSILTEDFFPLVDSSSMTTFRVSLGQVFGSSFSGTSGSLFASSSKFATSASWTSQSLSSSYAITASSAVVAGTVKLSQSQGYVPYWNGDATNSNLSTFQSQMYLTQSKLVLNADWIIGGDWWDNAANYIDGADSSHGGGLAGGIYSIFPIISAAHVGADQKYWLYTTGSQYYSGSGATETIGTSAGDMANTLNGRWIRISALPFDIINFPLEQHTTANNNLMREMYGHIRLETHTTISGSNSHNLIEMQIWNTPFGGTICSNVLHNEIYGPRIIEKIRIGKCYTSQSADPTQVFDPNLYIDAYVNNLVVDDNYFVIAAKSFSGAIRFVKDPTWGPYPPINTNSQATWGPQLLEFVPNVGKYFYIAEGDLAYECRDGIYAGRRLRIDPRNATITESRRALYDLEVSGTVGANKYYIENVVGKDAGVVVYNPATSTWYTATFKSGLLISSGSAGGDSPSATVNIFGSTPIGTIIDWAGFDTASMESQGWYVCDGRWFSSGSYLSAFTSLGGVINGWGNGNPRSGYNTLDDTFRIPDLRKRFTVGAYPSSSINRLKTRVGDTGGDEDFLSKHYHYFGTRLSDVNGGNDVIFQWGSLNYGAHALNQGVTMDVSKMVASGSTYYFVVVGETDQNGLRNDKQFKDFATVKSWDFVTSHPYTEAGNGDPMPPYAVVHKLIRLV